MSKIDYLEVGGKSCQVEWAKGDRKTPHQMKRQSFTER
jgi:hypothetical protein